MYQMSRLLVLTICSSSLKGGVKIQLKSLHKISKRDNPHELHYCVVLPCSASLTYAEY